jgi:hypothetical protein
MIWSCGGGGGGSTAPATILGVTRVMGPGGNGGSVVSVSSGHLRIYRMW